MNTNKLNEAELRALVSLIDEEDKEIFNHVHNKILDEGYSALPILNEALLLSKDIIAKERIDDLLEQIKYNHLLYEITNWKNTESKDLIDACIILARYAYPEISDEDVRIRIDEILRKIKEELKTAEPTRVETIKVLNKVILSDFQFKGNIKNYSGLNNSFINKVVEDKVGNPIMLCIIYLIAAKEFNIPLIGINSPGHFVLAYINPLLDVKSAEKKELMSNVLFYISPFYEGAVIQPSDFDKLLKSFNFSENDRLTLPADNADIIKRVLNNIIYAVDQAGEHEKAKHLLEILERI